MRLLRSWSPGYNLDIFRQYASIIYVHLNELLPVSYDNLQKDIQN